MVKVALLFALLGWGRQKGTGPVGWGRIGTVVDGNRCGKGRASVGVFFVKKEGKRELEPRFRDHQCKDADARCQMQMASNQLRHDARKNRKEKKRSSSPEKYKISLSFFFSFLIFQIEYSSPLSTPLHPLPSSIHPISSLGTPQNTPRPSTSDLSVHPPSSSPSAPWHSPIQHPAPHLSASVPPHFASSGLSSHLQCPGCSIGCQAIGKSSWKKNAT